MERPVIIPPPLPPSTPAVAVGTYKLCDPETGAVYYVALQSDGRILPVSGKV